MASSINASTSPAAIVQTADGTANLSLQSNGTTIAALTSTGMAVTGTLSASGVTTFAAGTAALPAITTTGDTDTGIWFPAANTVAASISGTEAMRIDSSGNVGIGTTSPVGDVTRYLNIVGSGGAGIFLNDSNQGVTVSDGTNLQASGVNTYLYNREAGFIAFGTSNTERMRIDSSGNLLVGTASSLGGGARLNVSYVYTNDGARWKSNSTAVHNAIVFANPNGDVGTIQTSGSATSYNTSSDYRLKENIAPMTGALDTVALLKPVTYKWKIDGSDGQGFIAHELQEIVPDCVSGEKDAVNEDGSIKPQGIDTSFLVATLTAAIQEQQALITSLTARITALEGA